MVPRIKIVLSASVLLAACGDPGSALLGSDAVRSTASDSGVLTTAAVAQFNIKGPSNPYLARGATVTLSAAANSSRGGRTLLTITWSSSNPAALSVNAKTGAVTALAAGAANIRAVSSAGTDSLKLYVVTPDPFAVTPNLPAVAVGATLQLAAATEVPVSWSSSDTTVAQVNAGTGALVGRKAGTARVQAVNPVGGSGATTVTVTASVAPPANHPTTPPPPADTTTTPPPVIPPPVTPPPVLPPPGGALAVELPRVYLDGVLASARSAAATRVINVGTSAAFQSALDTAKLGDAIVLQAGTTYTGPFTLRRKSGSGWITIKSSASAAALPAAGQRMRPAYASQLPRIVSQYPMEPAISTEAAAFNYYLTGVEITVVSGATLGGALVTLGSNGADQNTVAAMPYNLVLDRVYIHGTPTLNFQRCIALNSGATAIVDSWISECHGRGFDSQAIWGSNGSGPYKIVNNYLEGAGENVMFGGSDPNITGLLPSDIEFRRNHVYKPRSWAGVWSIKNSFELKIGRRVLIEGNIFENNWADAQSGFAVLFKSTNQDGRATWSQTSDVTFQYNVIKGTPHGLSMASNPEQYPAIPAARIRVAHNSFEGFDVNGRIIQTSGIQGLSVENNAGLGGGTPFILYGSPHANFTAINNLFGIGSNAVTSADGLGAGTDGLNNHAGAGWTFRRNVILGARASNFPIDNFYPASADLVGFLNYTVNWTLSSSSPYAAAGTDGKPVGPNYTLLTSTLAGVVVSP